MCSRRLLVNVCNLLTYRRNPGRIEDNLATTLEGNLQLLLDRMDRRFDAARVEVALSAETLDLQVPNDSADQAKILKVSASPKKEIARVVAE